MRRILFITRGGAISGSQRQLLYLLENLDRSRYEPIVICNKGGEFVDVLREQRIETVIWRLHSWRKPLMLMLRYVDAYSVFEFARQKKVSIIHCCDLWRGGYMLWAANRLKAPSILHVRAPLTKREVRKHLCSSADYVAAISKRIYNNLVSGGVPSDKVVRIDDSVDIEIFSPERKRNNVLRKEYQCNGEMLIGIIGRIDAFKRQLDFLKAAREIVRDGNRSVKFFIVGGIHRNSYFQKIRQFVNESGMNEYVRFTGHRNDMADVISSLDILVSLSGGSVMFEAMAAGKAVISAGFSTKETSVHIQDGKTGVLVESKEIKPLADAMKRLIDNQELMVRLGNDARQWAVKELSHVNMAAKTQEMYDLLINGRNGNK